MSALVEVVELTERDRWPFEDALWRCSEAEECATLGAAWLGGVLVEDADGREWGTYHTPFVAVFEDGTCRLVCEDCASALEEVRDHDEEQRRSR